VTGSLPEVWRAFAKVNLELRAWGGRSDGYHEVETVLQTIDLSDELVVSSAPAFRFTASAPPSDESNLVVRAVRAFEARTGMAVPLHLHLEKRVPIGAGLGGGSSDAAVTLMGLDRRFRTGIAGEDMQRMLRGLGSDVPFFYVGGRALAVGRGERVFPLEDAPALGWLVVACPEIRVSTADAYSWLTQTTESNKILGFCAHFVRELGATQPGRQSRLNDFEEPLFERFPALAEMKQRLLASGARWAALAGSGSSVFGEFGTESRARLAAATFGRDVPLAVVRPLTRQEYAGRMFETSGRRPV